MSWNKVCSSKGDGGLGVGHLNQFKLASKMEVESFGR